MTVDVRNALKSAGFTALWAFLGVFGLAVLDVLNDVGRWASDHGRTPFPDLSVLGFAAVAAACSAAAFVVNVVVRLAQAKGLLPGKPPLYLDHAPPGGTWGLVGGDEDGEDAA